MRAWSLALCISVLSASGAAARDCYAPTPAETARYQAIANRLAEGARGVPIGPVEPVGSVTQQELHWALELEKHVKTDGYAPTEEEMKSYQDIFARLQASQAPALSSASAEEIDWAMALEERVKMGRQPTAQETARYEDIARRLQASRAAGTAEAPASLPPGRDPATPVEPVSEADLTWAIALQTRAESGGEISEAEKVRYGDIFRRYTSSPAPTPPPPPPVYPQPYPQGLPPTWNVFGANEADIQWALDLERKVNGPCPAS